MHAAFELPNASGREQKPAVGPLDEELDLLWQEYGQSGEAYDLYLGRISRNPVVRSHATGKYFMLPWSRIIQLALEKGIGEK